ncbi:uncharacterized protein B0T23DRAFT_321330 [Neurospora hispaniola]|uniref:EF hand domain-containing protein n=1 Tax=Neurospora hispaniola TaxID=588809 RepID=A0AAJ0I4B4_9PEZI|nr:hypothetical protein B0T23DRAFT_321330 [Neurospora hispaniola]
MEHPSAAASTLTRHRIGVALFSCAAAASLGYFCYRIYNPSLPEPDPSRRVRRSNAVRHRRRSAPDLDRDRDRRRSDVSQDSATARALEGNPDTSNANAEPADAQTVADDQALQVADDDWWNDNGPGDGYANHRAGQNIVNLLFRVSEDNARRSSYVHRGCQCNACGIVPIRGIRYRCANCADFDLCETCESQDLHIKTHVFYKIKVPAPRLGPRQLQPVWYPGNPDNCVRVLNRAAIAKLSRSTGLERPELEALWEQWTFLANTEWKEDPDGLNLAMDRKTFERTLVPSGSNRHNAPNLLYDRMFAFYDTNNDDLIGFSEFLHATTYRKSKHRLLSIFNGYDIDGDGYVDRRDFLRLFRAYYVLFKEMHKDMLEGLDDQVMSSNEVKQLISSRHPVSSFFGREGAIPRSDSDRPLYGKVFTSNGDVRIMDGRTSAVNEDKPDTADREAVLESIFQQENRDSESLFAAILDEYNNQEANGMPRESLRYFAALLNPPARVEDLPSLLTGRRREGDDLLFVTNPDEDHDGTSEEEDGHRDRARAHQDDSDQNIIRGEGFVMRMNDDADARYRRYARAERNVRKKLIERYKRRQFYLDEEEGALPPDYWDPEEDILANLNGVGESSKPVSPRSPSSPKVRFAEDVDDYDTQSNPSTSSRSIPERWGGMEIPGAEKDAGKEVFYQVVQQAFNELLDRLFKFKEDIAIRCAETKAVRDKYRPLLESIEKGMVQHADGSMIQKAAEEMLFFRPSEDINDRDGEKPISEQNLQELLAASGYSVDETSQAEAEPTEEPQHETGIQEPTNGAETVEAVEEVHHNEPSASTSSYCDPTLPQFRPNSMSENMPRTSVSGETQDHSSPKGKANEADAAAIPSAPSSKTTAEGHHDASQEPQDPSNIPINTLVQWRFLDLAEKEAKERGGWGRLNYEEFETVWKLEEEHGNRLDYLGTWIDFCIPYH